MNHQIAMYFGHALLGNPRHEEIEARAIEWGCSIEFAILEDFDWLFTRTFKVHEDSSIFNLLHSLLSENSRNVNSVHNDPYLIAYAVGVLLKAALGLWLFFGAQGFVNCWRSLRNFGTPKPPQS